MTFWEVEALGFPILGFYCRGLGSSGCLGGRGLGDFGVWGLGFRV